MAKVINLNRARKTRARDERRVKAKENATLHGRTKAEKARDHAEATKLRSHLDQHKLDK